MSYQDGVASIHRDLRSMNRDLCSLDRMFRSIRRGLIITQWMMAATIVVQLVILVMLP